MPAYNDLTIEEADHDTGFYLCVPQKGERERMIRVTEKEYRKHVSIPAGSPPSPPAKYEMSWEIFPKYE
jgi:hypothetical protein